MLKGFVDNWNPLKPAYGSWGSATLEQAKEDLRRHMEQMRFDVFTFYSKWYNNGFYSRLPFLRNCPGNANVETQNDWGRQIIDWLHENGKSAGLMLQLLSFERGPWGEEAVISTEPDCLFDFSFAAPMTDPCVFADIAHPLYQRRVLELLEEHVTEFPSVDYLFLEFEGYIMNRKLSRYVCQKYAHADPVTFQLEAMEHCYNVRLDLDHSWSDAFAEICRKHMGELFRRIEEMLRKMGYRGTVGIVFYGWGYETMYMPQILPNRDWWLLPWDYPDHDMRDFKLYTGGDRFVIPWESHVNGECDVSRRRVDALKKNLIRWARDGYNVCFIGDGSVKPQATATTEELFRLCEQEDIAGFLAMGTPLCDRGLRWDGFRPEDAQAAAELYRRLYR